MARPTQVSFPPNTKKWRKNYRSGGDIDVRKACGIGLCYGALCFAPVLHFVNLTWARVLPSTSIPAIAFKVAGLGKLLSHLFVVCGGHGNVLSPKSEQRDLFPMFVPQWGRLPSSHSGCAIEPVAFIAWRFLLFRLSFFFLKLIF